MKFQELTDHEWEFIKPLLPPLFSTALQVIIPQSSRYQHNRIVKFSFSIAKLICCYHKNRLILA